MPFCNRISYKYHHDPDQIKSLIRSNRGRLPIKFLINLLRLQVSTDIPPTRELCPVFIAPPTFFLLTGMKPISGQPDSAYCYSDMWYVNILENLRVLSLADDCFSSSQTVNYTEFFGPYKQRLVE